MATVNWKGYVWDLRDGGTGGPGFGGWKAANVSGPDGNDYITLKITNPTGTFPYGAEMVAQNIGLGYGTYTLVVGTRLDTLDKNIVFGGLFPIFIGNPYIEFDVNETSQWDTDFSSVQIGHNMWYGSDPDNPSVHEFGMAVPSDVVQTHRLIWSPGSAIFDSYLGTGTGGTNYFHTVVTSNVPAPSDEQVDINLWLYNSGAGSPGAGDLDAPATDIVLRDFTFTTTTATPVSVFNTVTVSESVTLVVSSRNISKFDSVTVSENISLQLDPRKLLFSDMVTVSESVTIQTSFPPGVIGFNVFDSVTVSENTQISPSATLTKFINVFDSVAVSENFRTRSPRQGNQMPQSRPQGSIDYGFFAGGSTDFSSGMYAGGGL